jgi:hypothetical protein
MNARLFGAIELQDLIPADGTATENAPRIKIEARPPDRPTEVVTTMDWRPRVKPTSAGVLRFKPLDHDPRLDIRITITRPIEPPGAEATYESRGTLPNFQLLFLDVIQVTFARFHFSARSGRKVEVEAEVAEKDGVQFDGDLRFVNKLREIIPPGALGKGASIDLTPTEVHVAYSLAVPPLSLGVFSLRNVSFSLGLTLPFLSGTPLLDFAIADRHAPFLLAVGPLGGGGFLHVQVGTDGVKRVEVSLEFGGNFSLDIGVASGGVHIMAGIYFALQRLSKDKNRTVLSGFLRCGGELSVLGLISVSVEFNLSFTYDGKKATGRATLTVTISIAFFSKSIDLTVERSFGPSDGDPYFGELMDADAWHDYAAAFA